MAKRPAWRGSPGILAWTDPDRLAKHGVLAGAVVGTSGVALGMAALASLGAAVVAAAILTYAFRADVWAF